MAPSTNGSYLTLQSQKSPGEWEKDPFQGNEEPSAASHHPAQGRTRPLLAWLPEFIWLAISAALLIAIVVVLYLHHDKPLPEWPRGLTLNTVVATLSTFCRVAFVVAVTESASQLKWNWFAKGPRPLNDLVVFDSASRGSLGGIKGIWSLIRSRSFAGLVPPIILLTGLATSTLTQSAISFSTRSALAPNLVATSHSRRHYPTPPNTLGHDRQDMVDNTNRAMFQAVFGPVGQPWPLLEPTCPSAECRWPLFSSLAVCVAMKNVTSDLIVVESPAQTTTKYTAMLLGFNVSTTTDTGFPLVNMTSPEQSSDNIQPGVSLGFDDQSDLMKTAFSQFFFVYNNKAAVPFRETFRAVELLWHLCVNTYNVSVTGGIAKTEVVASHTNVSKIVDFSLDSTQPARMELRMPKSDDVFTVYTDLWEFARLGGDMRRALEGSWGPSVSTDWPYSEANKEFGRRIFPDSTKSFTADEAEGIMWDGIKNIGQTIADSMTNFIRQTDQVEKGQAFVPVTIVRVRWEWLAFLATQIAMSIIFCVLVVIQTSSLGVDVVKSSVMAGLFAVPARDKAAMESSTPEPLFSKAPADPNVIATLVKDGPSWQLTLGWEEAESELARGDLDQQDSDQKA